MGSASGTACTPPPGPAAPAADWPHSPPPCQARQDTHTHTPIVAAAGNRPFPIRRDAEGFHPVGGGKLARVPAYATTTPSVALLTDRAWTPTQQSGIHTYRPDAHTYTYTPAWGRSYIVALSPYSPRCIGVRPAIVVRYRPLHTPPVALGSARRDGRGSGYRVNTPTGATGVANANAAAGVHPWVARPSGFARVHLSPIHRSSFIARLITVHTYRLGSYITSPRGSGRRRRRVIARHTYTSYTYTSPIFGQPGRRARCPDMRIRTYAA